MKLLDVQAVFRGKFCFVKIPMGCCATTAAAGCICRAGQVCMILNGDVAFAGGWSSLMLHRCLLHSGLFTLCRLSRSVVTWHMSCARTTAASYTTRGSSTSASITLQQLPEHSYFFVLRHSTTASTTISTRLSLQHGLIRRLLLLDRDRVIAVAISRAISRARACCDRDRHSRHPATRAQGNCAKRPHRHHHRQGFPRHQRTGHDIQGEILRHSQGCSRHLPCQELQHLPRSRRDPFQTQRQRLLRR
jgi:hypothetical protein